MKTPENTSHFANHKLAFEEWVKRTQREHHSLGFMLAGVRSERLGRGYPIAFTTQSLMVSAPLVLFDLSFRMHQVANHNKRKRKR